jgi:hypothetical protein
MTKDFHTCEECFDGITKEILKKFDGCKCPACMSLLMMSVPKKDEKKGGGVSEKSCLNGKCSYDSAW